MISPLECFLSEFERVAIERVFDKDNAVTTKLSLEFVHTVLERDEWKGLPYGADERGAGVAQEYLLAISSACSLFNP